MAIQLRRGIFDRFDPTKLLPGEVAVVTSGDPSTADGRSVYICFSAGNVKRLIAYEDIAKEIANALEDLEDDFADAVREATESASAAAASASSAASAASSAAERANVVVASVPGLVEQLLEDHPEWTTTVQDGAITPPKLSNNSFDALTAGSAASLTGSDATDTTLPRTSPRDGTASVESIHGRTLGWNQMVSSYSRASSGTASLPAGEVSIVTGHVYYLSAVSSADTVVSNGSYIRFRLYTRASGSNRVIVTMQFDQSGEHKVSTIFTSQYDAVSNGTTSGVEGNIWVYRNNEGGSVTGTIDRLMLIDLTRMFGAGNEPSTVAEFDRMFPEPYYPYDAGSPLSVNMTGIETVGRNLLDASTETAGKFINQNGGESSSSDWKHSDFIQVVPGQTYTFTPNSQSGNSAKGAWYTSDSDSSFVSSFPSGPQTVVAPNNARYVRVSYRAISENVQFEIGAVSTEYEPYWSQTRTIPAATYFPDGMRSAGSVYDELTATSAITRIGERAYQSGDESDTSVVTDGTVTHYALATPTITPIDPPLNMVYRAERGGTERVLHTEQTAPPTLVVAYGYTAESLLAAAASTLADPDGPTATTNHAVGSYLTMGGTLYRVTTAIAAGETVTPGTNVTATTVMAEVVSLIQ